MSHQPYDPELRALSEELTHLGRLRFVCGVYVFDAWLNFLCTARMVDPIPLSLVQATIRDAVQAAGKPLHRGGKLDTLLPCGNGTAFIHSYAGIYVLVVRFGDLPDEPLPSDASVVVRAASLRALPKISRLTLALPPPDGSGPGSAQGFGVA
jgi:hypothetical protein